MPAVAPEILIVGAGIGGLALAVALQQRGLSSCIWERSPEIREIGAGLLLTPNAVWILQLLELYEQTCELGRVVETWQIMDWRARPRPYFQFPCVSYC